MFSPAQMRLELQLAPQGIEMSWTRRRKFSNQLTISSAWIIPRQLTFHRSDMKCRVGRLLFGHVIRQPGPYTDLEPKRAGRSNSSILTASCTKDV